MPVPPFDPFTAELLTFCLDANDHRGIKSGEIIDALVHAAGFFIAGGAKPGQENSLLRSATEQLADYVEETRQRAAEGGIRLPGRDV
jgi:hypothetical protein